MDATELWEMRQAGMTLQAIGDIFGVSRERIRQILQKNYASTDMAFLIAATQVAKIVKCSPSTIYNYEKQGILKPIIGTTLHLYNLSGIGDVRKSIQRKCKDCGKSIPLMRDYCPRCRKYRLQHYYLLWTSEQKKAHIANCLRWREKNPERWKEIYLKANRKHEIKIKNGNRRKHDRP